MFSLVSKIVRRLTRLPFSVLALSAILAVLSIFPISQLRWDIQLQDTLSFYDQENSDYKKIENDFGGLGSLTVILRSSDSLQNYNSAKTLAERLQNDSLVHLTSRPTPISIRATPCSTSTKATWTPSSTGYPPSSGLRSREATRSSST